MAKTINQLPQAKSINISDRIVLDQLDGTKHVTIDSLDDRYLQDVSGLATKVELNNKAELSHTHENYATNTNVNALLEVKADKNNVYTKSEVDDMIPNIDLGNYVTKETLNSEIANKANKTHSHTEYAVKSNTYTKSEVDEAISSIDIPETDLTPYATKEMLNTGLDTKANTVHSHSEYVESDNVYSKEEIERKLSTKANSTHSHEEYLEVGETYSKQEIDNKIAEIVPPEVDLSLYASKELLTGELLKKADSEHTHTQYASKTNTYTKTEVNELIPDVSGLAVKSDIDALLLTKADKETTYTKVEIDDKIATIQPSGGGGGGSTTASYLSFDDKGILLNGKSDGSSDSVCRISNTEHSIRFSQKVKNFDTWSGFDNVGRLCVDRTPVITGIYNDLDAGYSDTIKIPAYGYDPGWITTYDRNSYAYSGNDAWECKTGSYFIAGGSEYMFFNAGGNTRRLLDESNPTALLFKESIDKVDKEIEAKTKARTITEEELEFKTFNYLSDNFKNDLDKYIEQKVNEALSKLNK